MSDPERQVLRAYYQEKDFITSLEGILKVVSVVACISVGALALAGGTSGGGGGAAGCGGGAGLAGSTAGTALAGAAAGAALATAALLGLPTVAPHTWLYMDVVASSLVGVTLVVTAVLAALFCGFDSIVDYLYLILALSAAAMSTGGAAAGFVRAMRRLDAARPRRERPSLPPRDCDA